MARESEKSQKTTSPSQKRMLMEFFYLQYDTLIISLNILDFKIKRVLVDPGTGFNLTSVITQGEILFPTYVEGVTKTTMFEVVDGDMGYNVILGRSWIHEMKVVPSTYHQLLNFPTPEGIKKIKGDQLVAREMNAVTVYSSKGKETSK
ncbi:uncharacterized protein [Nicotiana tomentosiformis]|uniref:uncharacterized protein n=1 Tax=Nicotiana tomentosiformis TaxID=4098 RepID=UPI00388CB361